MCMCIYIYIHTYLIERYDTTHIDGVIIIITSTIIINNIISSSISSMNVCYHAA